jgi:hypothetical protein
MAKRYSRDEDKRSYGTSHTPEPEPVDTSVEDDLPAEDDTSVEDDPAAEGDKVEEGEPRELPERAMYRVEQEGASVRGQSFEKGKNVMLSRKEAQSLAAGGHQISLLSEGEQEQAEKEYRESGNVPAGENVGKGPTDAEQRQRRQDTDTDRGQTKPPTKL